MVWGWRTGTLAKSSGVRGEVRGHRKRRGCCRVASGEQRGRGVDGETTKGGRYAGGVTLAEKAEGKVGV